MAEQTAHTETSGEHKGAVRSKNQFGEKPGEAAARLGQRDQAARGHIDALEDAPQQEAGLAHEPVAGIAFQQPVGRGDRSRVALGAEDDEA